MSPIAPEEVTGTPADGVDEASSAEGPVSDAQAPEGDDVEPGGAGGEPGPTPDAADDDAEPVDPRDLRIAELEAALLAKDDEFRERAAAFQRARTELERARDRLKREHDRVLAEHKVEVVTGLLGVLDDFDRSLAAGEQSGGGEAFVEGVKMIRARLDEALRALGLSRFDAQGEDFDPSRHEALSMQPVSDDALHDKVLHVAEAGALVGDKVVRPARVIVGRKL